MKNNLIRSVSIGFSFFRFCFNPTYLINPLGRAKEHKQSAKDTNYKHNYLNQRSLFTRPGPPDWKRGRLDGLHVVHDRLRWNPGILSTQEKEALLRYS